MNNVTPIWRGNTKLAYYLLALSPDDFNQNKSLLIDSIGWFDEGDGIDEQMTIWIEVSKLPEALQSYLVTNESYNCITLKFTTGPTSLLDVGITASVSNALALKNIPCNILAAGKYDHVFIPVENGEEAMKTIADMKENGEKKR